MSTKGHLYYQENGDFEMYHETSESVGLFWGTRGFNIYILFGLDDYEVETKERYLIIYNKRNSDLKEEIKIYLGDVLSLQADYDGLMIGVRGDSLTAKKIENGEFKNE